MPAGRIYYPEDKLPLARLIPMGLQHIVAMFGATVLAPILMGFNPQVALFFSGVGTLIFIGVTRFKVPSYLGSSFAFIGPVLAVTGGNAGRIPEALCGIAGAAALIVATGLGVKGITIGPVNIAGIAFGTVLALVLNLIMPPKRVSSES